jgi:hypothetical protein
MKKLIFTLSCFLFVWAALSAQPTCEDPEVVVEDDIENYAAGEVTLQSPNWDVWPGGATGGIVTDEIPAASGINSIKIDGTLGTQDVLFVTGDQTSGHYILAFSMYVPEGNEAYFNLQHLAPTANAGFWAFEVFFEEEGVGRLQKYDGSEDVSFSYLYDDWFEVYIFIDQDNDEARLTINERYVDNWQFSTGDTEANQINSINFYPDSDEVVFYVDDVRFWEIPAADMGDYCYTAEVLDAPGTYTVPDLDCWGASMDQGGNGSGFKGYWFTYTPETDGILSISSCGNGADSRGWIFSGECENLKTVGVNDDQCSIADTGSEWASYREAVVTAGTQYFIMWDDAWDDFSFEFELALSTEAPEEGEFCQSAQQIEPGSYDIIEITGNAAVAGPNINNTTGSTTNYAQAKWYQYIPSVDGYMSISACELAASDTHFFVYTGDCSNFEGLNLVAQNDNGCGEGLLTSALDSIEVTAGTVYYIEWIDRWDDEQFNWTLGFEATVDASTATFQVDMSEEDVSPDGVFVAGSFSDFQNVPMSDGDGDGIYTLDLLLENNATYTYKFKNGPDGWESIDTSIGEDCTTGGYADRFVEMGDSDIELDPVCFGYCVSCALVDTKDPSIITTLDVYPNPISKKEELNVNYVFENSINQLNIRLMDVLGQTVTTQQLSNVQAGRTHIRTAELAAGTYHLVLMADGQLITRMVIIQ